MNTAVLVLPAALACFLLAFARGNSWREAFLKCLVLLGVVVTLLTEGLGAAHLLRRGPLFLGWSAAGVLALLEGRRRTHFGSRLPEVRRPGVLNSLLAAGIFATAAFVGWIALLSPPNSADAMAYHMPRVVYWAQAGSVSFFPTPYYNQIMLQPLAEYCMLHTYVLSGGDHYVNLIQFVGFLGSIAGVSLIAQALGAGTRGQVIAALFCATIPNGILQASAAKNDYLLALWLVAMTWFAVRYSERFERRDLLAMSLSLGLALLTKGTAYLFAPPMLAAALAPAAWRERQRLARVLPALLMGVLMLNGPQYWRNFFFSGSVLGYDSAQGDGLFRWRNERLGMQPALSNVLRNLSQHLGARSPSWNRRVYDIVIRAHRAMGMGPNDPDTTWRWEGFRPPANSNNEATAPNRWQLVLLALSVFPLCALAWRRRQTRWLWYYAGVVTGFLLFCFYLKWMPWITRLHLPLFVLGSPIAGLLGEQLLPAPLQALLCLFLLNNARPCVFENWVRPLKGPSSLLWTARDDSYFSDMKQWNNKAEYLQAVALARGSGCDTIGSDISEFQLEYPFEALLLERNPRVRFVHTGVTNVSARYQTKPPPKVCAVFCPDCAGNQKKINLYRRVGDPVQVGRFLMFLQGR